MARLRAALPLPVAPAVVAALLLGGAVGCGGSGSGALPLPSATATPTRSLSTRPQPTDTAAVTPAPTTAPPTTAAPPATVTATATTTARPTRTPTPTAATSSEAVVAPSAVASATPTAAATATPTTAPVTASSDSGSAWGWWVLAIVLLAAVLIGILWSVMHRRRKWAEWRTRAAPVVQQTHVVADLLPVPPQRDNDPAHWQQVREQAEHNAHDLESVAAAAPTEDANRVTQEVVRALREDVSAVEALRLLEEAPAPPTGPELAEAEDVTRRAHVDLDASQARLDALIGPRTGADDGPPPSVN